MTARSVRPAARCVRGDWWHSASGNATNLHLYSTFRIGKFDFHCISSEYYFDIKLCVYSLRARAHSLKPHCRISVFKWDLLIEDSKFPPKVGLLLNNSVINCLAIFRRRVFIILFKPNISYMINRQNIFAKPVTLLMSIFFLYCRWCRTGHWHATPSVVPFLHRI